MSVLLAPEWLTVLVDEVSSMRQPLMVGRVDPEAEDNGSCSRSGRFGSEI